MGTHSTFLQFIFPHYKTKSEGWQGQKRACFLIRISWKEPGNAGGLFLCCFELHIVASNTSPVFLVIPLTAEYKNVMRKPQFQQLKGKWDLPLQCYISSGLFFPENLPWPSHVTMTSSSLKLFLLLFLQIWVGRQNNFTLLNISLFRFVNVLFWGKRGPIFFSTIESW